MEIPISIRSESVFPFGLGMIELEKMLRNFETFGFNHQNTDLTNE